MSNKIKALGALLLAVILWSFLAVISRWVVETISATTLNFLRLGVATLAFLPFFIANKPWEKSKFISLLITSLFACVNFIFFMIGLQYTSASAGHLIYVISPVLVLLVTVFLFREKINQTKIIGVTLGLVGVLFIIFLSAAEKGTTITGTEKGNLLVLVAVAGWVSYILASKKLSKYFSPAEISSTSIIVSFIISTFVFILQQISSPVQMNFSYQQIVAIVFIGFFGTFLTFFLYQYSIKHLSTLTASFSSYIQPITTALFEIIFLSEKLTMGFIIGGILVFSGVFLASTLDLYHGRKAKVIN